MIDDQSDGAISEFLGRAAGDPNDPPIERIRRATARRRARQRMLGAFGATAVFAGALVAAIQLAQDDDGGVPVAAEGPMSSNANVHTPPQATDATTPSSDEPIAPPLDANVPAQDPAPAPEPPPTVEVNLGVFDDNARPAEGLTSRQLTLGGNLEVEGGCVWALPSDNDPDSRPIPLEWRNGTSAHFGSEPGSFNLSQDGLVVAHNGDRVVLLVSDWPAPAARCQSVSSRQPLRVFGTIEKAP